MSGHGLTKFVLFKRYLIDIVIVLEQLFAVNHSIVLLFIIFNEFRSSSISETYFSTLVL